MRVSEQSLFNTYTKYDRLRQSDIQRITEELSSGKKLLKPSDNSVDTIRALRLKSLSTELDGYNRNTEMVRSTQEVAEGAMGAIVEVGSETRVEITRLLNTGVLDYEDGQVIKQYLESARDFITNQANAQVGGIRLFGGVASGSDPFGPDGTYNGAAAETTVAISKGVELNTTFNGSDHMGVNINSGKMTAVEVLDSIIGIIDSGDLTQLHTATLAVDANGTDHGDVKLLEAFDIGMEAMMEHRSLIGNQMKVSEDIQSQNETIAVNFSQLQSKLEDADYSGAISELQKTQTAYQALLAAFNQNKDLSLLNYF
ncbi:MAG TPA: flagellar hook protein [Chlorobaculum parvum]|uniref:Flagellar hook protein n=1 Tax=Chlorobaculum parvum TaxID=274539 RepID=A0A7C5HKA4_9CHLB|nr:flagellar hook protein [Chlorobaculum parvum]